MNPLQNSAQMGKHTQLSKAANEGTLSNIQIIKVVNEQFQNHNRNRKRNKRLPAALQQRFANLKSSRENTLLEEKQEGVLISRYKYNFLNVLLQVLMVLFLKQQKQMRMTLMRMAKESSTLLRESFQLLMLHSS